ncbi:MAG: permease [Anaerolineaceae bacterium]|nr:MAG: permease [Anaerolineaceae bacterium]
MSTQISHFLQPSSDRGAFALVGIIGAVGVVAYMNLKNIADWLTYTLMGLNPDSQFGEALNFFIYDVPKLLILLAGMIFLISVVHSFVDLERVREIVEKRGEGTGNVMAALFGAVTPFCSCSSVPLFIGFVGARIPLGITFSFLITSPMMNQVALVLLLGLFGWEIALLYLLSGITIGVVAGMILGRMKLERYVEDFVFNTPIPTTSESGEPVKISWRERFGGAWESTEEIVRRVWLYVIVGIGIGAFIHGFVPEDALSSVMGAGAWWSVPASVVLGIPLYSNAAGIIPIVSALLEKGAALGSALAFMMSVIALSLPEIIILRRVLKPRLLAIFVGVVALGILITGYAFNLLIG